MSKKPEKPKTRKVPIAQALARHKAAQAPIDAHFGSIDDDALANQLFTAESNALEVLAETPCSDEVRIAERAPDGYQDFGSILVAVDRHFNADRDFSQFQ